MTAPKMRPTKPNNVMMVRDIFSALAWPSKSWNDSETMKWMLEITLDKNLPCAFECWTWFWFNCNFFAKCWCGFFDIWMVSTWGTFTVHNAIDAKNRSRKIARENPQRNDIKNKLKLSWKYAFKSIVRLVRCLWRTCEASSSTCWSGNAS